MFENNVFSTSDHMMASSTKNKFLTVCANFLGSHVHWHNIENIYLAGT